MKIFFVLCLSTFALLIACHPNEGTETFTKDFIADSLGGNGFRKEAISFNNDQTIALINGKNIIHYSKDEVFELIGKPDTLIRNIEDGVSLVNYFYPLYDDEKRKGKITLYVGTENDTVVEVMTIVETKE